MLIWALAVLVCAATTSPAVLARTRVPALLAGLVACGAALLLPPPQIFFRFVLGMFGVLALGRTYDLLRRDSGLSFLGRLWLLTALFDVRRARRREPALVAGELRWLLIHVLVAVAGGELAFVVAEGFTGVGHWLLRWSGGVALLYGVVEAAHALLWLGYRSGGVELPRVNDRPILSTTLAEFWGRRWNRVVSSWLRDGLFYPLARRGHPRLGVAAAFVMSTAMHFWIAWMPLLDVVAGLSMASFFLVHGTALLLEQRLGVAGWSPLRRRLWTGAWFVITVPLFIEPALRIFDGFPDAVRMVLV